MGFTHRQEGRFRLLFPRKCPDISWLIDTSCIFSPQVQAAAVYGSMYFNFCSLRVFLCARVCGTSVSITVIISSYADVLDVLLTGEKKATPAIQDIFSRIYAAIFFLTRQFICEIPSPTPDPDNTFIQNNFVWTGCSIFFNRSMLLTCFLSPLLEHYSADGL